VYDSARRAGQRVRLERVGKLARVLRIDERPIDRLAVSVIVCPAILTAPRFTQR
jgi:hypothetical protein